MSEIVEIQDNASDGEIEGRNASYSTARGTAFNTSLSNDFNIGQTFHDSTYFLYRGYVAFNIPSNLLGVKILTAKIRMTPTLDLSVTNYDIQAVAQNWSGDIAANMEADYDGCLAGTLDHVWANTAALAVDTPLTGPTITDLTRIVAGQTVYFSFCSSRDKNGNSPSGNEYIAINAKNYRTSDLWPTLVVELERPVKAATFF